MSAEVLLHEFGQIGDAPDAIARLRRFVLEAAVHGRLVPQHSYEKDAATCLRKAALPELETSRKAALSTDFPSPGEVPFDLPPTWVWCRLNQVGLIVGGGTPPSGDAENFTVGGGGIPWFTPSDMARQPALEVEHGARDLTEKGLSASSATPMPRGTVLFTSRAPIGYVGIAKTTVTTNQGFKSLVPSNAVDPQYAAIYFRAFAPSIDANAPGTTFKEVSGKIVSRLPFPLPPLAEQHRIVTKVDELMAVCDKLEAAQEEREVHRDALRRVSLHRLIEPEDERADVRFFLKTSPRLMTKPEHVAAIRQTILDLAVRGRLVSQESSDGNGHALVAIIARSRKRVGGRKPVSLPEDGNDLPSLPESWTWAAIDEVSSIEACAITDGPFGANLKTAHYITTPGYRVVRLENIGRGTFRRSLTTFITREHWESLAKHHVFAGDIIVAGLVDPSVRACEIPEGIGPALVKADCYRFHVHLDFSRRFALYYLNSLLFQDFAAVHHHGMTLTRLGLGNFRHLPIPVPPVSEQHRIVAKVDELMAVCDELETTLTSAQHELGRLLEALLHDALEQTARPIAATEGVSHAIGSAMAIKNEALKNLVL